jgi:hypothetical protein
MTKDEITGRENHVAGSIPASIGHNTLQRKTVPHHGSPGNEITVIYPATHRLMSIPELKAIEDGLNATLTRTEHQLGLANTALQQNAVKFQDLAHILATQERALARSREEKRVLAMQNAQLRQCIKYPLRWFMDVLLKRGIRTEVEIIKRETTAMVQRPNPSTPVTPAGSVK